MARIDLLPEDLAEPAELVAAIRARRGGKLIETDRVLLRSPAFAQGFNTLARAVRQELSLEPKLRELAICGVGVLNGATYEVAAHLPIFVSSGGTPAQADALFAFEEAAEDEALFDACERAVMRMTIEMTREISVGDALFAELREQLGSEQAVVELVGTIGFYNMVSRILVALEIGHG